MSRRLAVAIGVVVLVLAGVAVYIAVDRLGDDAEAAAAEPAQAATVEVVRADLVERETLDGTVRFRSPRTLYASAPGTVTALPRGGAVLTRGDRAYELSGRPVTVMYGDRPAWRQLDETVPDGPDIAQLEANLEALGFTAGGALVVDETFDGVTADAVEEWQASLGLEANGVVGAGDVVFVSGPVRVGAAATEVGATVAPGAPRCTPSAPATTRSWCSSTPIGRICSSSTTRWRSPCRRIGDDRDGAAGGPGGGLDRERRLRRDEGRRVVEVSVDLADESLVSGIDEAPVDVDVASSTAENVLAVPVEALLALAEGGYAVEVADGSTTRLVAVEVGTFADGLVEITGQIEPGTPVVVPR